MIKRVLWVLLLLSILAAGCIAFGWMRYQDFLQPFPKTETRRTVEFTVEKGASAPAILEGLEKMGVLKNASHARLYLIYGLRDPPLQAGDYSFQLPATPTDVLQRIINGDVVQETVTLVEGLTFMETAEHLANVGFGDLAAFLEEMRNPERVEDLDPAASNLEGYLFPDTYSFPRTATESQIVSALVNNFRRQTSRFLGGTDVRNVVTLASIVEKEAAVSAERPLIAGVYAHRLRRGIGLYADPTLIYGKKLDGSWAGNLTRKDLRTDSAYNTYLRPGLPPSPICSPGKASLEAAAAPPDVPYLYFVSRNDGTHVFSKTLSEHNRNVNEWQRRYWRDRRAADPGR